MPPTEVGILVAQPQSVEQSVELSGRTTAFEISDVRPQASGVVLKRLFTEGGYVREGQALYEIDSSTNRTTVDNARAAIARAEANLGVLRVKEEPLPSTGRFTNAISKQEYDDIAAQVKLAEADLNANRATLRNAEINLGYSTVRAPISGQTNRSSVTAGALVTANQPEPLVTIERLDPIYVDINRQVPSFYVYVNSLIKAA